MGKDSLIKSTTKKKATAKKTKEVKAAATKKSKAAKPKSAPKSKTAPKKKTTAKTKAPTAVKTKKPAAAKTKKTAAAKPKTRKTAATQKPKLSIRDLTMKSFDPWKPDQLYTAPEKSKQSFTAPSFFSGISDSEASRLKEILFRQFDLTAVPEKAVKAKAAQEPVPDAAPTSAVEEAKPMDAPPICQAPAARTASDPSDKLLKYGGAVFVLLIALIIGASFQNQTRYYIKASDGAVDIWQGKFSPMGTRLLISLPGATMPKTLKPEYTKNEALTLAFNHFIEKADALLTVEGMPDFKGIKSYLKRALTFATSDGLRKIANARINTIDLMILVYKADIAGSKGTLKELQSALAYLQQAAGLTVNASQEKLVQEKIGAIQSQIEILKKKETGTGQKRKNAVAPTLSIQMAPDLPLP